MAGMQFLIAYEGTIIIRELAVGDFVNSLQWKSALWLQVDPVESSWLEWGFCVDEQPVRH